MIKNRFRVFTDGGARGNPGPAAVGIVIYDHTGRKVKTINKCIGVASNNQAEYRAAGEALEFIKNEYGLSQVDLFLDSELVARQLNGRYKVKDQHLKPLFSKIREFVIALGGSVSFTYVRREENQEADRLVNKALDSL